MPYNNITMYKCANEQKTLIQNCSLLHPFNPVVSYMIHACSKQQVNQPPNAIFDIYHLDGPSRQEKKQSNIFFDMAPACCNERVNEYPNTFFNTLIIYSTMGNFRLPHLTHTHVYKQLMHVLFRRVYQF